MKSIVFIANNNVNCIHTIYELLMDIKKESTIIILLALPIIANGFLESSYGFINTFLIAHLGEAELAVNALVSMLFVTLMVIFWGIISGVSIVISHYHGAQDDDAIRGVMRDSLKLSILAALPIMLLLWYAPQLFHLAGQSDFVVDESRKYLHALMWAVPTDLPGFALMQLFIGISKPRINFLFTLVYIPALILINYCFMFGKLGLPMMGIAGIGWGTTVAYTLYLIAMALFIYYTPEYRHYFVFKHLPVDKDYKKEILAVGLPLGAMYSVEIAYFLVLAVLMGKFGNIVLSAHQIVIQYFWIIMGVTFSIGQALSIRTGWRLGRNESQWIMPITIIGQMIALSFTFLVGLLFWIFPHDLIMFDFQDAASPEKALVTTAVYLFAFAAVFQIFESIRVIFFCVLRGMKDAKFTLFISMLTFWGIALPSGYYLAFIHHKNPAGLWEGLIISGIISSILLWLRLKTKTKTQIITSL